MVQMVLQCMQRPQSQGVRKTRYGSVQMKHVRCWMLMDCSDSHHMVIKSIQYGILTIHHNFPLPSPQILLHPLPKILLQLVVLPWFCGSWGNLIIWQDTIREKNLPPPVPCQCHSEEFAKYFKYFQIFPVLNSKM